MFCCQCLWLIGVWLIYKVVDRLLRATFLEKLERRHILVTGCDTGFGHEVAKRLHGRGCRVFAGCLTEAGETALKQASSGGIRTIRLDVSNPDSVRNALQIVKKELPENTGLWGVLNNAGVLGHIGPLEWLTIADYQSVMSINLLGLIDVTMTFLPLVKQARGRVVNTASVFGRMSMPGATPYAISKYGVEAFSDGLRRQLRPYGCSVHLIEPGLHKTQITSENNVNKLLDESWNQTSSDIKAEFGEDFLRLTKTKAREGNMRLASSRISDVVDVYEHALLSRHPRARYVVGLDALLLWLPLQYLPEWIADKLLKRINKDAPVPDVIKKRQ